MPEVKFYDEAEDSLFKFAVIIARSGGKWVFCKHKERDTLENPGGHREPGETMEETARRELYEETGALEYTLKPICPYSYGDYGMLYFAEITRFEGELHSEIERVYLLDELPREQSKWTYPQIQPHLVAEARRRGFV
ncbi:MAG: NUDIX domain-containing protein [Oscillospiraceae bacterium]|nr:NUDIX domain-containing protein [Oscillospiraceae bacterium]